MRRILVALALASSAPAHANLARPESPGARSTEVGGLREIAIEHEQLTFDLRPLVDGERGIARVAATYRLVNGGEAVTSRLVFVSGMNRLEDARLTFDGREIMGHDRLGPKDVAALPASWSAPISTPALDGGGELPYESEYEVALGFTVTIPPGKHELAVSYAAFPEHTRSTDGGTLRWQVGYVLAPARNWGGFGTLDVSVEVPAGWRTAVTPALVRTGDTLRGHFVGIPADTLGITAQAPTGMLHAVLQVALPVLFVIVIVAGIPLLVRRGRALRDRLRRWPSALAAGFVWAAAIGTAGEFAACRSSVAIPAAQSAYYGYGQVILGILAVLGALVAMAIGVAIVMIVSRPPPDPDPWR